MLTKTNKSECQCFLCQHVGEPHLQKAYCVGYKEACEWFLDWAKRNNIQMGSISDDDLGGIYAQIECNHDDVLGFMSCFLDIEERKDEI